MTTTDGRPTSDVTATHAGGSLPEGQEIGVVDDPASWDGFVLGAENGSYLQLSAWARVKAPNGWRAVRLTADGPTGRVGAQILVRTARPSPWGFAYAPRGPVAEHWAPGSVEALTAGLRRDLPSVAGRLSHLRIDPEIELDGPHDPDGALRSELRRVGWRPAPPVQPDSTRLVDLRADADALWSDLRKKWRQYVNRGRANGVTIREAGRDGIGDYHRIIDATAQRVGFIIRTEAAYRAMWDALAPDGLVRLLFADAPDGTPVATLFLIRCGDRVVEPFGGMTSLGADLRANYLLKWESMLAAKAAGATTYDMWGLASPGIAHFKAGFGGRDVRYIGAWDLVFDRLGLAAFDTARRGRIWLARRRHGVQRAGEAE
jgi:peptidoglycan pentaglycine glycine transferase (the first glycine)